MSTDKELLELAAKAAGIKLIWRDKLDVGLMDENIIPHPRPHWVKDEFPHGEWNPLADDGDALRLFVKLSFSVDVGGDTAWVFNGQTGIFGLAESASGKQDIYAATRRAIVRAAAEIGRGIP